MADWNTTLFNKHQSYTVKIYTDATYTYIAEAKPGTLISDPFWRVKRVDSTGNTDWANGADTFINSIADLTTVQALTYS